VSSLSLSLSRARARALSLSLSLALSLSRSLSRVRALSLTHRWVRDLERSMSVLWDTFVFTSPASPASAGVVEGVTERPRLAYHIALTE
jgi:hypothetical protein